MLTNIRMVNSKTKKAPAQRTETWTPRITRKAAPPTNARVKIGHVQDGNEWK